MAKTKIQSVRLAICPSANLTARAVRSGKQTALGAVDACLRRIRGNEGSIKAWIYLDPKVARAQAREIDADATKSSASLAGRP